MNIETINKINKVLFITLIVGILLLVILPNKVFAKECEPSGAYGETCTYNKTFELDKKVKLEGEDVWKDKVVDVTEDDVILFEIEIENIGEVKVDDMRMEDFLPNELEKIGGSGLTEYWDGFEEGEKISFEIEAKIKPEEFDREEDFEKCVVNKAEVEYDGTLEGADTATVCYGNIEIEELPETGIGSTILYTLLGLGFVATGVYLRKRSGI